MKPIPNPWKIEKNHSWYEIYYNDNRIAIVPLKRYAQAMVTLPELLYACKEAKERLETIISELIDTEYDYIDDNVTEMVLKDLNEVIKKAEGDNNA